MPKGIPPGRRDFGLVGAGKGSAERSVAWREHYDEIDWGVIAPDGFVRVGQKQVKRYGPPPAPQPQQVLDPGAQILNYFQHGPQ